MLKTLSVTTKIVSKSLEYLFNSFSNSCMSKWPYLLNLAGHRTRAWANEWWMNLSARTKSFFPGKCFNKAWLATKPELKSIPEDFCFQLKISSNKSWWHCRKPERRGEAPLPEPYFSQVFVAPLITLGWERSWK